MKLEIISLFLLLLVVLGEFVESRHVHKSIRPYKYHRVRASSHKPRWHQFSRPSRYGHVKKRPPESHFRRPSGAWKGSNYTPDHSADEQPYTIEIELPKRQQHGYSSPGNPYHRNYNRKAPHKFHSRDYYPEEHDDVSDRGAQPSEEKRVRIKVVKSPEPKLRIKISRDDREAENHTTSTLIGGSSVQGYSSSSLGKLGQVSDGAWKPDSPAPSFPEALRGA